jgi:hypothetical protein
MAKHAWIFVYGAGSTVFTTDVLSFSGTWGRQNYLDNYAGGGFSVTIKNNTNQAASFVRGTKVKINFSNGNPAWEGKVTTVDYNDYAGNTGLSTATVQCIDLISQAGKFTLQNFNYTQTDTLSQAVQTNAPFFSAPQIYVVSTGNSTASGTASSYTGTILNRLNILNNTERGQLKTFTDVISFISRKQTGLYISAVDLKRTGDSSTVISYTNFRRIGLGDNFMNQVEVTPETVASQLSNNTVSQTAYGISGYSVSTADSTTDQAAGLASWLSTMQGDPATYRYEVDFSDVSCNATAFYTYLRGMLSASNLTSAGTLEWQAQGQSLQTVETIIEGMSFSGTPDQTNVTVYLSPIEYYSYFVLDSTIQGILDTSRLGW